MARKLHKWRLYCDFLKLFLFYLSSGIKPDRNTEGRNRRCSQTPTPRNNQHLHFSIYAITFFFLSHRTKMESFSKSFFVTGPFSFRLPLGTLYVRTCVSTSFFSVVCLQLSAVGNYDAIIIHIHFCLCVLLWAFL